jgi:hypothetical protein
MRKIGLLYVGPGAWLVGLNLLICWAALVPCFLEGLSLLSVISIRYIGGFSILSAMFALIVLAAIGKARYVVCAPVLLPACTLLPALLLHSKIPWKVKLVTLAVELSALAILLRTVRPLILQYHQGQFKGLF